MIRSIQLEKVLFDAARNVADPGERRSFLDHACNGNAVLRERMDKLLAAQGPADAFFADRAGEPASARKEKQAPATAPLANGGLGLPPSEIAEGPGIRIGRYRLLQRIGEGGCGVVYLAEQEEPVRRRVALKIIRLGMDTENVIARFDIERQALAIMDHPNIARVLDAGATLSGRPYFIMELVRGVKITEFCDEHRLELRQRLELFIQIAHAIQHAHQKGIIHRDIKPSNILVTLHDGLPVPKVIDFGIAKATESRLADHPVLTGCDHPIGTPVYMSPEQAEMSGLDVDTRSDIYSLGVLLYELLTGKTPFDRKTLLESGLGEWRRTLKEKEPPRPSNVVTNFPGAELKAAAKLRRVEPPKLISLLKGDLDWIVMKALEKDRTRRYETANGLAMDVRRYLNHEPIVARPPSRVYQFQKLVRRNKVVFAAAAAVSASLIIGLGFSTYLYFNERAAWASEANLRQQAEVRERITRAAVLISNDKFEQARQTLGQSPVALIQPSLEAAGVFRALGQWHAVHLRWDEAAACFTTLLHVNQVDAADTTEKASKDLLPTAPTIIELGDDRGYDRLRRAAINRFATTVNPVVAEQVIKVSLLRPAERDLLVSLEPLSQIVAKSLDTNSTGHSDGAYMNAWRSVALGLLEYRRGHWTNAAAWCRRSLESRDQNAARSATARLLVAMTEQQLGNAEEAKVELAHEGELIESRINNGLGSLPTNQGYWFDWIIARILLREANEWTEPGDGSSSGQTQPYLSGH